MGNAGVGVVSMKGAPLALLTLATAQFRSFFDCGRAVRCMLLLGFGRFMHLVVLYGYQGAAHDLEQLVLTENLFDAASSELSIIARGQPCLIVGDFNEEPTKGISAGLWVGFEEAWALAAGLQPAPTCERGWSASGGHRRNFMVGCPLAAAAAVLSCRVQPGRWTADHLAVRTLFECCRWTSRVTQPLLWPAFWLSAVEDAMRLDESLEAGDVSRAWPVWSGAAEAVLIGLLGSYSQQRFGSWAGECFV